MRYIHCVLFCDFALYGFLAIICVRYLSEKWGFGNVHLWSDFFFPNDLLNCLIKFSTIKEFEITIYLYFRPSLTTKYKNIIIFRHSILSFWSDSLYICILRQKHIDDMTCNKRIVLGVFVCTC